MTTTYGITQALRDLIIRVLERYGEASSVDDLVRKLEAEFNEKFPRSTVWKHLSVLVEEGIVKIENGKYILNKTGFDEVKNDILAEYILERLNELKELLTEGRYGEFTQRIKTLLKMSDRLGISELVHKKLAEYLTSVITQMGDSEAIELFARIYEFLKGFTLGVLDEILGQYAKRLLTTYYRQLIEDLNADIRVIGEWASPNGLFRLAGLKGLGILVFPDDVKTRAFMGFHELTPLKALETDVEFLPILVEKFVDALSNYTPDAPSQVVRLVLAYLSLYSTFEVARSCMSRASQEVRRLLLKHALKAYEFALEFIEKPHSIRPGVRVYYRVINGGLREFSLDDLLEIEGIIKELVRKR